MYLADGLGMNGNNNGKEGKNCYRLSAKNLTGCLLYVFTLQLVNTFAGKHF